MESDVQQELETVLQSYTHSMYMYMLVTLLRLTNLTYTKSILVSDLDELFGMIFYHQTCYKYTNKCMSLCACSGFDFSAATHHS